MEPILQLALSVYIIFMTLWFKSSKINTKGFDSFLIIVTGVISGISVFVKVIAQLIF